MARDINIDPRALDRLARDAEMRRVLEDAAVKVRDEARSNAASVDAGRASAIVADEPTEDAESAYVDVGYEKGDPGFVLWFHEVGTVNHPARPHLRPALRAGIN